MFFCLVYLAHMRAARAFQQYIYRYKPEIGQVVFLLRTVYHRAGGPLQEPNTSLTYYLCTYTVAEATIEPNSDYVLSK